MFERFTANARRAVVMAQEEARRMNHNYIGTEHVLLGLLRQSDGLAHGVLDAIGVSLDGAREEIVAIVGTGRSETKNRGHLPSHIPFTPRAKKILELSLREALALHNSYIGTEHILLGVIQEGEGVAAQVLRGHAPLLDIRARVLDLVPAGDPAETEDLRFTGMAVARRRVRGLLSGGRETGPGPEEMTAAPPAFRTAATPAADATLAEAARLADGELVGSHHLLLAALADPQSAAARVFARLGVDLDRAKEALRGADVTGTSDEPPAEAGRRQMSVRVAEETVTITLTDPVIVAAGQAALQAVRAAAGEAAAGEMSAGEMSAGTIRGDDPAAASFAGVWEAVNSSLTTIAERARPSAAA